MAVLPTRKVTCRLFDQQGNAASGARIQFRLTAADIVNGILAPEEHELAADVDGVAVFDVVPNVLGVNGTQYRVRAWNPDTGKKFIDTFCTVPDQDCELHQIMPSDPPATVDAAQQAILIAQQAVADAAASAIQAGLSEDAAAASEAGAAASALAAAASADVVAGAEWEVNVSIAAAAASATAAGNSAIAAAASATFAGESALSASEDAAVAAGAIPHIGPTPPVNPSAGWEWIDSVTGRRYNWFEDVDSGQWIETGAVVSIGYGALDSKVDKVAGKGLSTEDYTTVEKSKLAGVDDGATANSTDAQLRDRSTHTGEQAISTVTGLQSVLDSLSGASGGGDVTGPASSTANNLALFDGVTGKVIKDGGVSPSAFAAATHGHIIGDVTGLQSALDSKSSSSHSHVVGDVTGLQDALDAKQTTLVSGTSIKTINGASLLGSGDVAISSGASDIDAMSIAYSGDGSVATVTEDGLTKTMAYNADGTINTISWPVGGGVTRTETYSYTSGVLTGMTAAEA